MLRHLRPKGEITTEQALVEAARIAIDRKAKDKAKKILGPWTKWSVKQKQAVVQAYEAGGKNAVALRFGPIPKSTLKGWRTQLAAKQELPPPGRPSHLSVVEETHVMNAFRSLRESGVIVDSEILTILGEAAVKEVRRDEEDLPILTSHWVKSFRRRHGIKGLRRSTTDRPTRGVFFSVLHTMFYPPLPLPLSSNDIALVNSWRFEFTQVVESPLDWGIPWDVPIPIEMQLGLDETPLQYVPRARGTYNAEEQRSTYIISMLCTFTW